MARLPETTKIARILDIIWMISRRPRHWTRADLAEAFEVSERTITNDLEYIRHSLKFELESDYGRGYYFRHLPNLPSVSYSVPEALALILAAQSVREYSGVSRPDLAAAIARLAAVIPDELRTMVDRLGASESQQPVDPHRQEVLESTMMAASTNRRLRITYEAASSGGVETEREVDPYAVIPYLRSWHLIGYCHLREDIRIFKLDRIRELTTLKETFTADESFDLDAFLGEGWGLMRGLDAPVEDVALLFHPPAAQWVSEEHWHASQRIARRPDGDVIFRVRIQITPEFQRWVFRYGSQVEVIEPDHLREWVKSEARRVLEITGDDPSTRTSA